MTSVQCNMQHIVIHFRGHKQFSWHLECSKRTEPAWLWRCTGSNQQPPNAGGQLQQSAAARPPGEIYITDHILTFTTRHFNCVYVFFFMFRTTLHTRWLQQTWTEVFHPCPRFTTTMHHHMPHRSTQQTIPQVRQCNGGIVKRATSAQVPSSRLHKK